ncbi:hypothetical protein K435DRAFT_849279 [Dendrothele bispora CBS 962.96]|uniref:BTB domain-containing protein n=1 Tax=Dendrothele bispora (strain CBS 962.96) TaxID=1314807 RepID=A0A4S8MSN8_DENBC|nr:hypothetical protein K435DRAFT_849279 [Dendrothele bispora CBS 962.96]
MAAPTQTDDLVLSEPASSMSVPVSSLPEEIVSSGTESTPRLEARGASVSPIRNTRHYWEPVTLLVDAQLFKVPRYHLEKGSNSEDFRSRLPPPDSGPDIDGCSDKHPLKLEGDITVSELESFLEMLYPSNIPANMSSKTEKEWIAILKVSTLWGFPQIRRLAIKYLTSNDMTALTKIQLARNYSIPRWLRSGYVELVKQIETLKIEDVESLGYPSSIRIFRVREQMIRRHWGSYGGSGYYSYSNSFSTSHWDETQVRDAVEEEFVGELIDIDERAATYEQTMDGKSVVGDVDKCTEAHEQTCATSSLVEILEKPKKKKKKNGVYVSGTRTEL